jgi:hypothetical protein
MKEEYIGLRFNKLVIVSKAGPYIDPSGHQYTQVNCMSGGKGKRDSGGTKTLSDDLRIYHRKGTYGDYIIQGYNRAKYS